MMMLGYRIYEKEEKKNCMIIVGVDMEIRLQFDI